MPTMRIEKTSRSGALLLGVAVLATAAATGAGCRAPSDGGSPGEVQVHVGSIGRATLYRYVEAYGRIVPAPPAPGAPPARAVIGAPTGGLLFRIGCSPGEKVAKGSTLFELDPRAAEVAVRKARTALDYAERTFQRQRELLAAGGTSKRAVQDAEQQRDAAANELTDAETRLDLLRITAPIGGTVVRIDAALGQPVEPNTVLAEIIDLDRLVVEARVPSSDAADVEPGQAVELAADRSQLGRVIFVGADVDANSDTVVVRASVTAAAKLRPGQFLEVRIVTGEASNCLVVPESSVVSREGQPSRIVLVVGGTAVHQPVTTGLREGGLVEITGPGVEEGAMIVTDDAYALPEDTKVRVAGD